MQKTGVMLIMKRSCTPYLWKNYICLFTKFYFRVYYVLCKYGLNLFILQRLWTSSYNLAKLAMTASWMNKSTSTRTHWVNIFRTYIMAFYANCVNTSHFLSFSDTAFTKWPPKTCYEVIIKCYNNICSPSSLNNKYYHL